MNPFELLVAIALYEDPNHKNSEKDLNPAIAFSIISLVLQIAYLISYSFLYGNLVDSTQDMTSNQEQGPQKNSRRFRKWAAMAFAALGFSQIVIGFVTISRAKYSEAAWIVVFNGLINLIGAAYMLVDVFTTLPIGPRMNVYKDIFYVFALILYAIVAFVAAHKIKEDGYQQRDYTTYALMGVVGVLGSIAIILNRAVQYHKTAAPNAPNVNQPSYNNQAHNNNQSQNQQANRTTTNTADIDVGRASDRQNNSDDMHEIF